MLNLEAVGSLDRYEKELIRMSEQDIHGLSPSKARYTAKLYQGSNPIWICDFILTINLNDVI